MIKIENIEIGLGKPPFVIAEMSGNHNQSLERALKLVDIAAASGAHALKLQTYTADTMTLNCKNDDFLIKDENSLWSGQYLYPLYQMAYTPWEWHDELFKKCKRLGIIGFSTPYDESSVDFLESLNVPCYKVASFENTHLPLIAKIASLGKPMIISTGMASLEEITEAVSVAEKNGAKEIILLKCTSAYPAPPEASNLSAIPEFKKLFPRCEIGVSDHTMGIGASVTAVALGATVIERHFTDSRDVGGVDSDFSLEPHELASLVKESKIASMSIGSSKIGISYAEKKSLQFRRSIYISKAVKKGEVLSSENIRIVRPGYSLAPKYYSEVLGKKVRKDLEVGDRIDWSIIE